MSGVFIPNITVFYIKLVIFCIRCHYVYYQKSACFVSNATVFCIIYHYVLYQMWLCLVLHIGSFCTKYHSVLHKNRYFLYQMSLGLVPDVSRHCINMPFCFISHTYHYVVCWISLGFFKLRNLLIFIHGMLQMFEAIKMF
jgi:hypothetical protein